MTWVDVLQIAAVVAATIVLVVLGWLYWRRLTPAQRAEFLATEAQRAVEWAEETLKTDPGSTKYLKVLSRLAERFPQVDQAEMEEYIQQAVLRMKGSRAARHGANLNGKNNA